MSQPYIGEIRLFGFNFAPSGWAFCQGQLLSIAQNTALFQLLGTTYGGDGVQTFALPNLLSRVAIGQGQGFGLTQRTIGETGGVESVTLTTSQLPTHTHAIGLPTNSASVGCKSGAGNTQSPVGNILAGEAAGVTMPYSSQAPDVSMGGALVPNATPLSGSTGGSQPHFNVQPYLTLNYCISLFGIFPSQQ
jgi:microcystin-dependent protein